MLTLLNWAAQALEEAGREVPLDVATAIGRIVPTLRALRDAWQSRKPDQAQRRHDLERLRERYLPGLGEISATPDRDYAFRARVSRQELAEAMGRIVADIDYPNFKSAVAQEAGYAREQVYDDVWEALLALQYGKAAHGG